MARRPAYVCSIVSMGGGDNHVLLTLFSRGGYDLPSSPGGVMFSKPSDRGGRTSSRFAFLQGPVHTRCMQIMEHTAVNGSVHTGCKQHQSVCMQICAQICFGILCEWGPSAPFRHRSEFHTKCVLRSFQRLVRGEINKAQFKQDAEHLATGVCK